jgi:hypothetical protein
VQRSMATCSHPLRCKKALVANQSEHHCRREGLIVVRRRDWNSERWFAARRAANIIETIVRTWRSSRNRVEERDHAAHGQGERGSRASRSPSPIRLKERTAKKNRDPRPNSHPGRVDEEALRGIEHTAPRRRGRLLPKAEERQRRFGDDAGGDRQRCLHQ